MNLRCIHLNNGRAKTRLVQTMDEKKYGNLPKDEKGVVKFIDERGSAVASLYKANKRNTIHG